MNYDSKELVIDNSNHLEKQRKQALVIEVLLCRKEYDGYLLIGKVVNDDVIVTIIDHRSKDKVHYSFDQKLDEFIKGSLIVGEFAFYNVSNRYNTLMAKSEIMRVDWCVSKEDFEEPIIIDGLEIEHRVEIDEFKTVIDLIDKYHICGSFYVKFTGSKINDRCQIKMGKRFVNLKDNCFKKKIGKYVRGCILVCVVGYKGETPIINGYSCRKHRFYSTNPKIFAKIREAEDMFGMLDEYDFDTEFYYDDEEYEEFGYDESLPYNDSVPEGFFPWEQDEFEYPEDRYLEEEQREITYDDIVGGGF